MNAVTTVAAALKRATLETDDGDLVLDFPGGERLRLKVQAARLSTGGDVTDRETIPLNTAVDFDDDGSWWRATPDGTTDGAPDVEELLEIDIDPHLENVGDVDRGDGIETDGGRENWPTCPVCGESDNVACGPEAGYWYCAQCGERGSGPIDDVTWWRNDPDSQWYVDDGDEITTDGGRVVPSDYDSDDGWGDNGLEQCPHCGDQLGGESGRHEDVYDQRGRHFEYFLYTDSSKGPFFCPDCWEELDRNQKAEQNDTLEAYTDGGHPDTRYGHLRVVDAPDYDIYCNGERMTKHDEWDQGVTTRTRLNGYEVRAIVTYDGRENATLGVTCVDPETKELAETADVNRLNDAPRPTFRGETVAGELLIELVQVTESVDDGDEIATDGGRVVPSDYDSDDGWGDNGLEQCPHCGDQLGGESGRHEDVYDQRGRHFEHFLDTDSSKGPFFCPDCWEELDRNRKAAENDTLEAYTDGAGERIAVSELTGIIYAVAEYEEDDDGRITALDKRPLSRAEIAARLDDVHGPVRRAYREDLGVSADV
jgi:uncharacterized Zn ribbon protein